MMSWQGFERYNLASDFCDHKVAQNGAAQNGRAMRLWKQGSYQTMVA